MLAHLKLSILFIAAISWHLQDVRAQEDATPKAAPKEAAPKDPTPKDPTPKDPAPKAAPPKAAAPAKAAPKVTALKNVDYTVLAEPAIANRLALTDEQRAAVAANLNTLKPYSCTTTSGYLNCSSDMYLATGTIQSSGEVGSSGKSAHARRNMSSLL